MGGNREIVKIDMHMHVCVCTYVWIVSGFVRLCMVFVYVYYTKWYGCGSLALFECGNFVTFGRTTFQIDIILQKPNE